MKIHNNVNDYIKQAKQNDIVVFAGKGLIDGITTLSNKYDTYKVVKVTDEKLVLRAYRGRSNLVLGANNYDQAIAVLTKEVFNKLLS